MKRQPAAKHDSDQHYDLILIGSGMGSLAIASLMAQLRGQRVLVLERHFKAGGFTHDFQRQQFHWDVGLHYVGQMGETSQPRKLFDLITDGQVQWTRMPEPFERFVYPGRTFSAYGDKTQYIESLIAQFPHEARAIHQYFRDISKAAGALTLQTMQKSRSKMLQLIGTVGRLFNRSPLNLTTQAYLEQRIHDPQLRAVLASQWGTYGLPPQHSPFAIHATIVQHYLEGGYYPVGGAGTIAPSVEAIVEEHGGRFLLNRAVTQVVIEQGRAVGVQVRNVKKPDQPEETYYAPVIVSGIGAANTYLKLIPPDYPIPFWDSLRQFVQQSETPTTLTLYLGLKADPRQLGFQGENHWLYTSWDHNATYQQRQEWVKQIQPSHAYLSFPSLKDPQAKTHTAEIITFVDYESFAPWRDQQWLRRGEDYQALKAKLADALIALIDRSYPGFANLVAYKELSTPITTEYFTDHPRGAIYGLPLHGDRFKRENWDWTRPTTPLPGLYLTGADVISLGIVGALMGGVFTLSDLLDGISFPEVFKAAAKSSSNFK